MNKMFVLMLAVLFPFSGTKWMAQDVEHAPTVAQCQADQRLWLAQLERDGGTDAVSFRTLRLWGNEMTECADVDPPNSFRYLNTLSETAFVQILRLQDFLVRHNITDQFYAEDEAGKR